MGRWTICNRYSRISKKWFLLLHASRTYSLEPPNGRETYFPLSLELGWEFPGGVRSGCLVKVWILDRWRAINFVVLVDWIPIGKLRGCGSDEVLDNLNLHHPQSHCRQVLAKTKRAARSWKLRGGSAPQVLSEGAPSRYVGVLGCLSKGRREWVSERSDFSFSAIYRATWRYQSKPYCTNTLQVIKFLFIVS